MNKLIIFILIIYSLAIPLFSAGTDHATGEVFAYKNREYETDGLLKIIVKEWVTAKGAEVEGIGNTNVEIPSTKVNKSDFDPFSVYVYTNLQNAVTVDVIFGDFISDDSDMKITPDYVRWFKYSGNGVKQFFDPKTAKLKSFDSGDVMEGNTYYRYRYYPTMEYVDNNKFKVYFMYDKVENASLDKNVEFPNSSQKQSFDTQGDLLVLPGISTNREICFEVVYRWKITSKLYNSLPEGVKFVSTVTINIKVD